MTYGQLYFTDMIFRSHKDWFHSISDHDPVGIRPRAASAYAIAPSTDAMGPSCVIFPFPTSFASNFSANASDSHTKMGVFEK